jgi:hypothetical protein
MHNRTRNFVPSLVLLSSLLLSTVTISAQQNTNDWSRLNSVAAGSKLAVELKNGKTVDGKFSSVTESFLTVTVKNAPVMLKREDVLRVHQTIKKSAKKSTLLGLAIGAGAGGVIGLAADASSDSGFLEVFDNSVAGAIAVVGAGAGAATGYFLGRSKSQKVLLYEAK